MTRKIPACINHQMLVWGRESMGLSLDEASQKTGISLVTLRDAEKGLKKVSVVQLRKISKVYKRPMPIFYLKIIPNNLKLPDFRVKSKIEEKSQISGQINFEIRNLHQKKKIAEELFISESSKYNYDYIGLFSKDTSPKIASNKIRNLLGINTKELKGLKDNQVLSFWKEKVENLGILIFQFSNKFVGPDIMRGFVFAKSPFPTIAINVKDTYYGRVFTIIHELSHIILDISAICDPNFSMSGSPDTIELLCNKIAGETLVPDVEFFKLIEKKRIRNEEIEKIPKIISKHFKVSYGVGLQKLFNLNRIDNQQYFFWLHKLENQRIQKENERRTKKGQGGPTYYTIFYSANSSSYIKLIFQNLSENKISNYSAMKSLGVKKINTFAMIEQIFYEGGKK